MVPRKITVISSRCLTALPLGILLKNRIFSRNNVRFGLVTEKGRDLGVLIIIGFSRNRTWIHQVRLPPRMTGQGRVVVIEKINQSGTFSFMDLAAQGVEKLAQEDVFVVTVVEFGLEFLGQGIELMFRELGW